MRQRKNIAPLPTDIIVKTISFSVDTAAIFTKDDSKKGNFTGHASVFGNLDSDKEIIDAGAFTKSLQKTNGVVPILWQHNRTIPIGWNSKGNEDAIGLFVDGDLLMETEYGRHAYAFVEMGRSKGAKVGLSVGFKVPTGGSYIKEGIRHFKEVDLVEYSIVTFPANEEAGIMSVKGFKSADFNTTLSQARTFQALYDQKWNIECALDDSICSIKDDEDMTLDQKKAAITESINQYAVTLANWHGIVLDLTGDDGKSQTDDSKTKGLDPDVMNTIASALNEHDAAITMHAAQGKKLRAVGKVLRGLVANANALDVEGQVALPKAADLSTMNSKMDEILAKFA